MYQCLGGKMNELKLGLDYAVKHSLSVKEMEILTLFMDKPYNSTEIAELMNTKLSAVHAVITRLKLKRLIEVEKTEGKFKIYKFNL